MASQSSRSLRATRSSMGGQRRTILCHHGEPPVLKVASKKENPRSACVCYGLGLGELEWVIVLLLLSDARWLAALQVGKECGFFQWANQEHAEKDPEKVRLRNKVLKLKLKLKAIEGKLKIAAFVRLLGWLGLLVMWL
ncbi:hypothetical protein PIB30_065772 [Stylosanthes scabra]|uniref:Uncharacterized protein n=1 Tax=Stylosanthes scabra TaxID=79078 RepID=A0ABU6SM45_9FABA|nr:hypothetical protein [Stylosanthes scabra]